MHQEKVLDLNKIAEEVAEKALRIVMEKLAVRCCKDCIHYNEGICRKNEGYCNGEDPEKYFCDDYSRS